MRGFNPSLRRESLQRESTSVRVDCGETGILRPIVMAPQARLSVLQTRRPFFENALIQSFLFIIWTKKTVCFYKISSL